MAGPNDPQQSGPSYTYDNQYKTDQGFQNRNSFGGVVGGADTNVNRYRQLGQDAANRGAYQANYSDLSYGQGQARSALDLQRQAATGNAPSAAEIAGRSAMDRSLNNQVAAAGSARGGPMAAAAAMRGAQQTNAMNEAQMQQQIQAGRAAEMAQARGQFGDTSIAYGNQGLQKSAQQIQNEQFQRGLNQQGQQFNEGLGFATNEAQLQANQNAQGQANAMGQANIQNAQQSSDFGWGKAKDIMAMVGKGAGGAASAGSAIASAAARGGPVHQAQPYLVGEEGPELVIPKQDATVIPAAATASLLGLGGHTPGHHREGGGEMMSSEPVAMSQQPGMDFARQQSVQPEGLPEDRGSMAGDLPDNRGSISAMESSKQRIRDYGNQRAAAEIRSHFEEPPLSVGDQAQKQYNAAHGRGKTGKALSAVGSAADQFDYSAPPPAYRFRYDPQAYGLGQPVHHANLPQPMTVPPPVQRAFGGPIQAGGATGMDPTAGSGMQLGPDSASLDVMGSLRKTNALDTQYLHRAGSNPTSYSDERTKIAAGQQGYEYGLSMASKLASLPPGKLHAAAQEDANYAPTAAALERAKANPEGPAREARPYQVSQPRRLLVNRGGVTHEVATEEGELRDMGRAREDVPSYASAPRKEQVSTPDPRSAAVQEADASLRPLGPVVAVPRAGGGDMYSDENVKDDANRRLHASAYAYKNGYTPGEQDAGELNYGPMAQSLERNPITATTVKKDESGMRMVDMHKLTKVHSGAIAHLQDQIDELRYGNGHR